MKKIVLSLILAAGIVIIIALMAPPITSSPLSHTGSKIQPSPSPTPQPTPIKLNPNSNLSEEAKKLQVSDYQNDYQKLDQVLSQF